MVDTRASGTGTGNSLSGVCGSLPKGQDRHGGEMLFCFRLCGVIIVLYLSDEMPARGRMAGVADYHRFLGIRYLCLCGGDADGKASFSELSPKKTVEGCVGGVVGRH